MKLWEAIKCLRNHECEKLGEFGIDRVTTLIDYFNKKKLLIEKLGSDKDKMFAMSYGDCNGYNCRMLRFRTEPLKDIDEVKNMIYLIDNYNDFHPDVVASVVEEFIDDVMYLEIGRESSPVIYVYIPFWTHQQIKNRDDSMGRKLTDEEREKITYRVVKALRNAKADEVFPERYWVRAWWD